MKTIKNRFKIAFLAALALILLPGIAGAQQMKILHGHVPRAISLLNLQLIGTLDPNSNLNLAISLPPQNQTDLNTLLSQIYDSKSTNYHHYLKPGEFTARFGPSADDYQKVVNFAAAHGLTVIGQHSNRTLLDIRGKASDVENAFQITLRKYHYSAENRDFYAPDTDPTVSADLPVSHITGLDNYFIPRPGFVQQTLAQSGAKHGFGSGPNGEYIGNDFRAAYVPGVSLNGAGQNVALFELDGYFTSDILSYEQQAGLPSVTLTNISVDGGVPNPTPFGDPEVSLDIEMAISMATNLSQVIVYEAPNQFGSPVVDELNRIAQDDLAAQISSSWLIGDNPAYDVYYVQMAVQGQSFFQCSGDNGAYYSNNEQQQQYADDTNVVIVGGTTLSTAGPGGAWSSETVWNWFSEGFGTDGGGGGTNYNGIAIPGWQQGVSMANNQGSTTLHNVPDVALTADNIYVIYENGLSGYFGGTSAATPLWAAFTALVNQQALANNEPTVGFLDPAIYSIGEGTNYTNCFHDIATGNNTNLVVGNKYFAVPGYDLCTGWGTPNGSNLINALTAVPATNIFTHLSAPLPPYGTTLGNLNGSNPNGNWYLFVQDDQVINSGLISNGWAVSLTTANPIGYVADVALTMTASVTNMVPGSDVTFYLTATNYGPNTSTNVVVTDDMPLGFSLISSNATLGSIVLSGQSLSWNIGNLTNTAGAQLNLTMQANDVGVALNSATETATTPNPNPVDNSAEVIVTVNSASAPSLTSAALGSGGKFRLTVSSGSAPVTIQASTNLMTWVNLWTNYSVPFTYTDSVSSGFRDRFYRAVTP
jgi:uncharacterized repeat protein (TIGR01451 family)